MIYHHIGDKCMNHSSQVFMPIISHVMFLNQLAWHVPMGHLYKPKDLRQQL
jgi:hypothetical protein